MEIKIFVNDKKILMLGGKKDCLVNLKEQTAFNLIFTPDRVVSQKMTGDELKFMMQNLQQSQTISNKEKTEIISALDKIRHDAFVSETFE